MHQAERIVAEAFDHAEEQETAERADQVMRAARKPGWDKPEGSSADDPDGRRHAKNKRKRNFMDRLYGPMPERKR